METKTILEKLKMDIALFNDHEKEALLEHLQKAYSSINSIFCMIHNSEGFKAEYEDGREYGSSTNSTLYYYLNGAQSMVYKVERQMEMPVKPLPQIN